MTVLLGIQERTPPAHRPMAVGMGETVHRSMNSLIALLLQDVHKACASEWARVLPLVHYIMMNTPILESGLVPRDLDKVWSLRDHVERELVPFRAPGQLPVDEWAKAVFRNFKTIESTLSRYLAMTEERRAELYDRGHLKRDWTIGEQVWRHPTMRSGTKFQPRSVGPYELRAITGQRATLESEDGTLISNIPLAELIRVPARVFDDSTDFERRSLGEIVGGKPPAPLPGPKGKFGATLPGAMALYRPSVNKKELIVGRVTQNLRESKAMVVVPYAGVWSSTRVRWSPGSLPAETVSYKSLFREVSLGPNGTLRYADLSAVEHGGYSLGASPIVVPQEVIDRSQCSTRIAPWPTWPLPMERGRPRCPRCHTSLAGRRRTRLARQLLRSGSLLLKSGSLPRSIFRPDAASGNVRRSPDYATKCAEGMKLPPLGSKVTEEHRAEYPDLRDEEIRAIGRVIFEKSDALWIKDTPQTMVRGFLHDMVTKGEPVSQAPLIRGGEHAEWLEAEIAKAYRRGHYVSGAAYGYIYIYIDYRRVNQVTVRATFVMPDSVSVKCASAGKKWYSTGDGVSGFNQIENSLFAQRVLAVVSLSGKHLPRSLGFGPTNRPEDFSRFGFRTFRRKLFKTWFLFIDDVLVATGRGQSLEEAVPEDQLAQALDAVGRGKTVRAECEGEKESGVLLGSVQGPADSPAPPATPQVAEPLIASPADVGASLPAAAAALERTQREREEAAAAAASANAAAAEAPADEADAAPPPSEAGHPHARPEVILRPHRDGARGASGRSCAACCPART